MSAEIVTQAVFARKDVVDNQIEKTAFAESNHTKRLLRKGKPFFVSEISHRFEILYGFGILHRSERGLFINRQGRSQAGNRLKKSQAGNEKSLGSKFEKVRQEKRKSQAEKIMKRHRQEIRSKGAFPACVAFICIRRISGKNMNVNRAIIFYDDRPRSVCCRRILRIDRSWDTDS